MSRKCLAFVEKFYELYAENKDYKTIAKEMDIPIRMVSKYLHEEAEWFINLRGELHAIATARRIQSKAKQNEALVDFLAAQKENNRKTEKQVYLSDEVGIRETDYKGSLSAHVYYSDVNGRKSNKKFNYSTYGKDLAWTLARKYREDMVVLVEQERVRLNKIMENCHGVSERR